ncbi:MAG: alpha/beta hydrolase [Roseibium sp.]|nr:alpha/beta hydrolase [Roseibium sp.]
MSGPSADPRASGGGAHASHPPRRQRRKNAVRFLAACTSVLVAGYIAAAGYMYTFQRTFVFKPHGNLAIPEEKGLAGVEVERIELADGTVLTVWHAEPEAAGHPTVLYFHGQGGNLSNRANRYRRIVDSGFGLFAPSYRGYAGSDGAPSEEAFVADGVELFDRLTGQGRQVIVHGESLGSGVAAAVAAARPEAELVVLEAPYTAVVDIAAAQYPWLPVEAMIKDPFLTRERIADIKAPVLIVHGTNDRIIPVEHGRALYQLADDPKRLEIFAGAGHGDLWLRGLWGKVVAYWQELDTNPSSP